MHHISETKTWDLLRLSDVCFVIFMYCLICLVLFKPIFIFYFCSYVSFCVALYSFLCCFASVLLSFSVCLYNVKHNALLLIDAVQINSSCFALPCLMHKHSKANTVLSLDAKPCRLMRQWYEILGLIEEHAIKTDNRNSLTHKSDQDELYFFTFYFFNCHLALK